MDIHWAELFVLTISPLELIVRGTCVYVGIMVLLRLVLRQISGNVAITDLLLLVLLADAAQNAMAADYRSITDGAVLIGTLVFWNYALDVLAYRFPLIGRLVHPGPRPIVRNGTILWRNMRSESVTREELFSQMREAGVEKLDQVKSAQVEGDGRISVIKRE